MSAPLNIAFFGSSLVSTYWNGAATYYRGIVRGLSDLGHRVTFYEPDAFERQQHRDMDNPDWAEVVVYTPDEASAQQCLERAREADVVVKASGVGVLDEFLEREVLRLRREETAVIFWDVDAPATLDSLSANPENPFCKLVPQYDAILTYGGGPPVVEAYRSFGAIDCIPVYNALDPSTHFPVAPVRDYEGMLNFLGNRMPDREARVEEFFFRAAAHLPRMHFNLGGNGWDNHHLEMKNVRRMGHVSSRDHNAFNCSSITVLNVNRASMARYGYSPATRIFEAAGAGACIISDTWKGIEMFLKPEKEILLADNGLGVAEHLLCLDFPKARAIGAAARRRILAEHTYAQRAAQVHGILTGRATEVAS